MKSFDKLNKILTETLIFCSIFLCIGVLWSGLELLLYGAVKPSFEDTVIGGIATYSIWLNWKYGTWRRK